MLRTIFGFLIFGAILAIFVVNYPNIERFSQIHALQSNARVPVATGHWEKAVRIYEEGWRNHPGNLEIGTRLAWYYRQNNQDAQSEALYRQIIKQHPDYLNARLGLGSLLQKDPNRVNEAIDQFRIAVDQHPESPIVLTQIGDLYSNAAENPSEKRHSVQQWLYSQAVYYYEASLKRNPKQFQTQFRLGVARQNLKSLKPAAQSYCEALLLKPDSYETRYNLGMTLTTLRYRNEGYRQMDRSVAMLSENGDMKTAMWLAQRVQNVKNAVYESREKVQPGIPEPAPDFLPPACLADAPKPKR